jgi:hypothetical protein
MENKKYNLERAREEKVDFKFGIFKDAEQRKLLMERVEELVDKIKTGGYENIIFLDKSARPLFTLFHDFWSKKYKDEIFPQTNFINIGRKITERLETKYNHESWEDITKDKDEHKKKEYMRWVESLSGETVMEFIGEKEKERVREEYHFLANAPKGSKVAIIQEIDVSGSSTIIAQKILNNIFPDLIFEPLVLKTADDKSDLFRRKGGFMDYFSPPWRTQEDDDNYGIVGVVDDKNTPLTAKPTREFSLEERLSVGHDTKITKYKEEFEDAWNEIKQEDLLEKTLDKIKKIEEFRLDGAKFDGDSMLVEKATVIAQEYMAQRMLPLLEEAKPYLNYLKNIDIVNEENYSEVVENFEKLRKIGEKLGGNRTTYWVSVRDFIRKNQLPWEIVESLMDIVDKILKTVDDINEIKGGRADDYYKFNFFPVWKLFYANLSSSYHKKRREIIKDKDYQDLINKFRDELHHVVEEYWGDELKP